MAKNGNKKERDIRTISLGKRGEPARELIEIYERKFGKNKLSKLFRELIVCHLSPKKEFDEYKIKQLKQERKEMQEEIKIMSDKIKENGDKIIKIGGRESDL